MNELEYESRSVDTLVEDDHTFSFLFGNLAVTTAAKVIKGPTAESAYASSAADTDNKRQFNDHPDERDPLGCLG